MAVLRGVALVFAFIVAAVASLAVCVARPFHRENNRICARLFAWGGLRSLGMRVRQQGWQHLPRQRPHVIIANHQSNLDLYVLGSVVPRNSVVVGKHTLRWVPLFGQIFWLGGNVLIQRRNRRQALSAMQQTEQVLTQERRSVWIMPEGTRSRGRGLLPFKKGAFYTAVRTGCPISMVCVSDYSKSLGRRPGETATATVRALPPIETAHLSDEDVPALMAQCRNRMQAHLDDLNGVARPADEDEQRVA